MSESVKGVNAFLGRIPRELHEQYMTDYMTELLKLNTVETNNRTKVVFCINIYSLLHSKGKHESSSHLCANKTDLASSAGNTLQLTHTRTQSCVLS